jgi:hypothetical protein
MSFRTISADAPARLEAGKRRALAWCVFLSFFALYLLSSVDAMLVFTDSMAMVESARRMLHAGIGPGEGQMHEKWCLGQLLIDALIVTIDELFADTPVQNFLQVRIQSFVPAGISAAVPTLVFLTGLQLGYQRLTSILAALCAGVGTITWVYSQILFSETTLGLLWLVVVYAMVCFTEGGRASWLWLAGIAGGYALITKTANAAALPVLPLWLLASLWNRQRDVLSNARALLKPMAALCFPIVAFAALNLWYNYARFGGLLSSGYTAERDGESGGFTTPLLVGLFGLVLSPGKGFFFYSPIALLGLFGIGSFVRRHRLLALSLLGIIAAVVLVHARWWAWHGDWAWGPRFMVPLAPLFTLFTLAPISRMLSAAGPQRSLRLLLTAALLGLSIGIQALGLAFDPGRFIDVASGQCRILQGGTYFREGEFPLLDDGFIPHFVPHFSPISGHFWMLRAELVGDKARRSRILHNPPWRKLNRLWVPRAPNRINTKLDLWWFDLAAADAELRPVARTWLAALWLLLAGAATMVVRRVQPAASEARRRSEAGVA